MSVHSSYGTQDCPSPGLFLKFFFFILCGGGGGGSSLFYNSNQPRHCIPISRKQPNPWHWQSNKRSSLDIYSTKKNIHTDTKMRREKQTGKKGGAEEEKRGLFCILDVIEKQTYEGPERRLVLPLRDHRYALIPSPQKNRWSHYDWTDSAF